MLADINAQPILGRKYSNSIIIMYGNNLLGGQFVGYQS